MLTAKQNEIKAAIAQLETAGDVEQVNGIAAYKRYCDLICNQNLGKDHNLRANQLLNAMADNASACMCLDLFSKVKP